MTDRDAEILSKLKHIFSMTLNLDVPSADVDLIEEGLMDSLSLVTLMSELEQEFNVSITIDNLEIDHFRSLRSICSFVRAQSS